MRKDVECTFGILKQRWRVLKSGIRLHSLESCDRIFETCCALHNFLLEADGMDIPWDGYYACEYENEDFQDYNAADIPASIHELYREYGSLDSVDLSTTGVNNVFTHEHFHAISLPATIAA